MGLNILPVAAQGVLACALLCVASTSLAQKMYKCGNVFQDRMCESEEVQKRFSRTSGSFSVDQVNPETDKECASAAANAMPIWRRLDSGESVATLRAEFDAKPISGAEKSRIRDQLNALKLYVGSEQQVRSLLEKQ